MKFRNAVSRRGVWGRWVLACGVVVGAGEARGEPKGLSFQWTLGSAADVDAKSAAHFTDAARIGDVGTDGSVSYRTLKPKVYQAGWVMPAFDIDPELYGEIKHPFFLTVHFKDVSTAPVTFMAYKGGAGFYGQGWIGKLGGAGDGQWKDQTLVIPESMMRSGNGKTFTLGLRDVKEAVPVASMTLFSAAATDIADKDKKIADALGALEEWRHLQLEAIKKKFKEVPLPATPAAAPVTAEETAAGYRIFFPPNARQLFANSEPQADELVTQKAVFSAPGQTQYVTVALRGLKDVGRVAVKLGDFKGVEDLKLEGVHVRWAQYEDLRVGASWGTDYRLTPCRLTENAAQGVGPERLEIAAITFTVPEGAKAGTYQGTLSVAAERGEKKSVPVTLTVYPFKLEHPDHATHTEFYYCDYGNFDPLELQDMRYHGIDGLVTGMSPPSGFAKEGKYPNEDGILAGYALLKKLGFRSPVICNLGLQNFLAKETPENEGKYVAMVKATKEMADKGGFASLYFPIDEPHTKDLITKCDLAFKWIKEVPGTRTYVTANPNAVKEFGAHLDDVGYNITYLNAKSMEGVRSSGQRLMFYSPGFDSGPSALRYRAGYYFAKINAENTEFFAYFETAEDPMNDLDGPNRDWTSNYPSMTSPYHDTGIGNESFREGVYDYKYIYTLRAMADRAVKGGHEAAGKKALAVLEEVLSPVSLEGNKAGGPELAVEADTSLKGVKVSSEGYHGQNARWYDESRQRIAQAIIELQAAMK